MRFLKRLFNIFQPQRGNKAKILLTAARIFAVSSFTTVLDRFPDLEKIDIRRWDFIMTIGGLFVAVSQLNHEPIPEPEKNRILYKIAKEAVAWHPQATEAFKDCQKFVDRTYDGLVTHQPYKDQPEFLFSDSLGCWIVWNLLEEAPQTSKDSVLARVLGGMLVSSFISWWRKA